MKGKIIDESFSSSVYSPRKKQKKSFSCTSGAILSYFNVKTNKASGITVKLVINSSVKPSKKFLNQEFQKNKNPC